MPTGVKVATDAWTAAELTDSHVLRPVNRGDQVLSERMTAKVVWQLLQPYAVAAGVPGIPMPTWVKLAIDAWTGGGLS